MSIYFKTATVAELGKLYKEFIIPYFPDDEIKPCENIQRMMEEGLYQVIAGYEANDPVVAAFITTAPDANAYLLDYLAVKADCRSKGYGGAMLKRLTDMTEGKPILIETEAIEVAKSDEERLQRTSRNAFYERNGAVASELTTLIFGVTYTNWELSANECKLSLPELINEITAIYRYMVPAKLYEKFVQIPALSTRA